MIAGYIQAYCRNRYADFFRLRSGKKIHLFKKKKVKQSIDDKAMMFEDSLPKMLVMDYCSSCFEQLAPNKKVFTEIME